MVSSPLQRSTRVTRKKGEEHFPILPSALIKSLSRYAPKGFFECSVRILHIVPLPTELIRRLGAQLAGRASKRFLRNGRGFFSRIRRTGLTRRRSGFHAGKHGTRFQLPLP